jgi:hypothetical protein
MPPPAVQPARVFEKVALVPGTPVKKPVVSTIVVVKPVKATPAVPYISARSQAMLGGRESSLGHWPGR